MSIIYCDKCDKFVDTDFNAEHFDEEVNGCEATFEEKTFTVSAHQREGEIVEEEEVELGALQEKRDNEVQNEQ